MLYAMLTSASTPLYHLPFALLPPCESALLQRWSCSFQKIFVSPPLPCLLCSTDNSAFSLFSDKVPSCTAICFITDVGMHQLAHKTLTHTSTIRLPFPSCGKRRCDLFFLKLSLSPTGLNPLSQKPRHLDSPSLTRLGVIRHHVLPILPHFPSPDSLQYPHPRLKYFGSVYQHQVHTAISTASRQANLLPS